MAQAGVVVPTLGQDDLWQRKSHKSKVIRGSAHVALASAGRIAPNSTPVLERGICMFIQGESGWATGSNWLCVQHPVS